MARIARMAVERAPLLAAMAACNKDWQPVVVQTQRRIFVSHAPNTLTK
jgi:hypothetical protein